MHDPHVSMSMADVTEERARSLPQAPAVITDEEVWTYAELGTRVEAARRALWELGLRPGDHVGLIPDQSPQALVWLLAGARAGVVLVPVNTRLALGEVVALLRDAEVEVVLVEPRIWADWSALGAEEPRLRLHPARVPSLDQGTGGTEPVPAHRPAAEDPLLLLYTSGSTGMPKGCVMSHRALVTAGFNLFYAMGLRREDRYLATMPLFHIGGIAFALAMVHAGAAVVFAGSASPRDMAEAIARHRISLAVIPFLQDFLDLVEAQSWEFPSLRMVTWGSQMESTRTLSRVRSVLGVQWRGMFGSTEGGNVGFITELDDELANPGTIGRPVPGLAVQLVSPESGAPTPVGEVGEICVRGPSTMTGYWANPEATQAVVGSGWVRTGDLAIRRDDGSLMFAGRAKDMIKSGGENVFAGEVEQVLRSLPGFERVAVIGVPDRRWGETVVAAVETGGAPLPLSVEEVRSRLRDRLAAYKLPTALMAIDTLPEFQGKVRKAEIRARWLADQRD